MHTVADLKLSVKQALAGLQVDQLGDIDGALEKAARIVLLQTKIPQAIASEDIALYDGVFDYPVEDHIFGSSFVDVQPMGNSRNWLEQPTKVSPMKFDLIKKRAVGSLITLKHDRGIPITRIVSPRPKSKIRLDTMQSDDGWVAAGQATSLLEDSSDFFEGTKSLRFNMSASGTGTLTKTIDQVDLTEYQGLGVVFLAIEAPDVSLLTNMSFKLGSSASAYDMVTATEAFIGAWKSGKWMLVAFDMATATTTGSPTWSAIDYVEIGITGTGAMTNFRVGDLFIARPSPHELIYSSAAIWKPTGGNPSQHITNDSDEIILSDDAYLLLEEQAALTVGEGESTDGSASSVKLTSIKNRLYGSGGEPGEYKRYRAQNPSQRIRETRSYGSDASRLARRFHKKPL